MTEMNRAIFSGMQILSHSTWLKDHAVVIEDQIIKAIIPTEMIEHHLPAKRYEYHPDDYLVPGFIDLHVHGAQGKDVMDGSENALKTISRALAEEGVTGYLATTMTASPTRIETVLQTVANLGNDESGAIILGVHLEGPFIARSKMGAQLGDEVLLPDTLLMKHWQSLAKNNIKIVTLAPELPGAIPFIESLKAMDIIASAGHTNATYVETEVAIASGCQHATHLFNAMRGLHQRDPGASGALLLANSVTAELIVDGVHLHPAIVDLAYQIKGKDRLLLVTDAMRAKCLGNGKYELGGQTVEVIDDKVTLPDNTLAGSVLRMPHAIRNMAKFAACSLAEAVYMASLNPARVLNLDGKKGSIEHEKDADLVVMSANFEVKLTMIKGKEVFRKNLHK